MACDYVYFIQKYKRVYEYKNEKFQFANEFKSKWVRFISEWIPRLGNWFFGMILLLSIIAFSFSTNIQDKIIFGIYILVITPYLVTCLTWNDDKKIAKELMT